MGYSTAFKSVFRAILEGTNIQVGWWEMSVGSAIRCVEDTEE